MENDDDIVTYQTTWLLRFSKHTMNLVQCRAIHCGICEALVERTNCVFNYLCAFPIGCIPASPLI